MLETKNKIIEQNSYNRNNSGAAYIQRGFRLIWHPDVRIFVIIPLLANLLLMGAATFYAIHQLENLFERLPQSEYWLIRWLAEHFSWLLYPIAVFVVLAIVFYLFAVLANWLAAPFNGLLSEAVERLLAGNQVQQDKVKVSEMLKDLPRLLSREWQKLVYFIPRALACLILFLPITPIAAMAPLIWFLFNSWMAALQYIDYPMDNHKRSFQQTRALLQTQRGAAFSFGMMVSLLTLIPVVNLLVMPAAVAGGTLFWWERQKPGG